MNIVMALLDRKKQPVLLRHAFATDCLKAFNLGNQVPARGRDVELIVSKTGRSVCAGSNGCCRR